MKKIVSLLLLISLLLCSLAFVACGTETPTPPDSDSRISDDGATIHIGVMSGPTGMGMAKLISDNGTASEKYVFDIYTDPKVAIGDLASGDLDMVCLPTNTAAAQAKAKSDYISVLVVNCLGSLYIMSDENTEIESLSDLEGKTIYTSVPNSTTKPILSYVLEKAGVHATIETEVDHPTLVTRMADGADHAAVVVLPEPYVTKARMQYSNYSVDINLSTEWSRLSDNDLAMGCIVVRNEFLRAHEGAVQRFMTDYKGSVDYIAAAENLDTAAQMIVDTGILGALPLAKTALSNLSGSIVYRDGKAMKNTLISFYNAIGQALPDDAFYYEKK